MKRPFPDQIQFEFSVIMRTIIDLPKPIVQMRVVG